MILALLCLRRNRRPAAWLILVPLAIFQTAAIFIPSGGSDGAVIGLLIMVMGWSLASWLLVTGDAAKPTLAWILQPVAILFVIENLVIWPTFGRWNEQASIVALYPSLAFIAIIIGALISRRQNRFRPTLPRVAAWLGIYMVALLVVGVIVSLLIAGVFKHHPIDIARELPRIVMISSIMGLVLNALFQPFMLLGLRSTFWRERIRHLLRLPADGRSGLRPDSGIGAESQTQPALKLEINDRSM